MLDDFISLNAQIFHEVRPLQNVFGNINKNIKIKI